MTSQIDNVADGYPDYDGPLLPNLDRFDVSRLLDPASLRALAVMVAAIVLVLAERTPRLYSYVIGAVLIVSGVRMLLHLRSDDDRRGQLAAALALLATGIVLVVWPGQTTETVARIVGAALVGAGLLRLIGPMLRLRAPAEDRLIEVVSGGFLVVSGIAVLVVPLVLGRVAIGVVALLWFVEGLATLVTNLRRDVDHSVDMSSRGRLVNWVEHRPNTASDRDQLYQKLFFEGSAAQRRLSRFFILMAFATIIASYGVATNSTATVIGAMLVAPLMTPLMGTTVSLVMGWRRRALMSIIVAAGGILVAVGLGYVIGATLPFDIAITNPQVSSRISPTLADLAIAVAAGAAGAFGLSRPDVSDALPGVAIAISLVPPLAVTGLMLADRELDAAWGSTLLFTTNMVAILLAGAATFVLTGIAPIGRILENRRQVQSSLTMVGALGILVVGVLAVSSQRINHESFNRQTVTDAVDSWLVGTDLTLADSTISKSSVEVVVTGSDQPPSVEDLGPQLESDLGRSVAVTIVWVPNQTFTYDGSGG